jgi:hypothetical protein
MKNKELKTSPSEKEWNLEVSEEQYETMKAKGYDEETLFKPGTHTFRRRHLSKIVKRENKTVILHLDEETFEFYQNRASDKSIEEQISSELRTILEKEVA